ncbi:hypothetical protein ACHHYP_20837 [Achlya hypogyna]|uniref:Uncharacterized protein n=1 Tax=Achlya hypogyna TaxID=1202772 RepID=A0A1V9Y5M8_ACHHY|nr:hypothetical protein ACHHYP_20837 [Achlya hypogyna]
MLSTWQSGTIVSTIGHDTFLPIVKALVPEAPGVSKATEEVPQEMTPLGSPRLSVHRLPISDVSRVKPSEMLLQQRPPTKMSQRVLSPRELSLAAANRLAAHVIPR